MLSEIKCNSAQKEMTIEIKTKHRKLMTQQIQITYLRTVST